MAKDYDTSSEMLKEEVERQLKNLGQLSPGDENYQEAVESASKLYKLQIEDYRVKAENEDKKERLKYEKDRHNDDEYYRRDQEAHEISNRWWQRGLEVFGIAVPLMVYSYWTKKGFKFEETGSITSKSMRDLSKWFKPTFRRK